MEDNEASALLIFEAPGEAEWKGGSPIFSAHPSSAAARIRKAQLRVERVRTDYDITNAVQCFPGKGPARNGGRSRDAKPPDEAIKHCSRWLQADIQTREYKLILVFGNPAKAAVNMLPYTDDPRFQFLTHPTGGLTNAKLDAALRL